MGEAGASASRLGAAVIAIPIALLAALIGAVACLALIFGGSAGACAGGSVGALKGAPERLAPIYQRAAAKYRLGPKGPSILAAINKIESGFGTNMGPSSAGAIGWMQFMPSTWERWGTDATGDGLADPWNAEDAIYSAAR